MSREEMSVVSRKRGVQSPNVVSQEKKKQFNSAFHYMALHERYFALVTAFELSEALTSF
jgi:hypothetical protein